MRKKQRNEVLKELMFEVCEFLEIPSSGISARHSLTIGDEDCSSSENTLLIINVEMQR